MNVVIVLFEAGSSGPIQRNALRQASYLASLGHQVALVSNTLPAAIEGVRFVQAASFGRSFRMGPLLPQWSFSYRASTAIERTGLTAQADCFVGHGHPDAFGLARLRKRRGVPFVIVVQGDPFTRPWGVYGIPLTLFYRFCATYAYRRADRVVVISRAMAPRVHRCSGDPTKVAVIPNGIDVDELTLNGPEPVEQFARVAAHEILFVGSLTPHKGCAVLVRAVARLRDLDLRCTFIGDGRQKVELQQLANHLGVTDRCAFRGRLPRELLTPYYAGADMVSCPSLDEPQGVVNLEALAMGCPVIASEVGGIPDMIHHNVNGLLTRPGDVDHLAEAIRTVCTDDALRLRLAAQARPSTKVFRWENVLSRFHAVLEELVSHRSVAHDSPACRFELDGVRNVNTESSDPDTRGGDRG